MYLKVLNRVKELNTESSIKTGKEKHVDCTISSRLGKGEKAKPLNSIQNLDKNSTNEI